jgi:hypothetical protein
MMFSRLLTGLLVAASALPASAGSPGAPAAPVNMTVSREVHRDLSRPMRDIVAELGAPAIGDPADYVVPNQIRDFSDLYPGATPPATRSAGTQRVPSGLPTPAPTVNANGLRIGLGGGGVPPDTTGDVGPNHYFQWVNTSWALFSKTDGALVSGPTAGSSFWAGFGGLCQTTNRGDPLVLFDDIAQRWVVSQFAFTTTSAAPFLQCVAVSTSADPLGTYNRYAFSYPAFNDYGKMGVWVTRDGGQNAYLFTMHEFSGNPLSFQGTSFALVERDRMLDGQSAQFIRVGGVDAFGALPMHLEGANPLADGACPVFAHFQSSGLGYRLWDMCVNWATGTTSFTNSPTLLATEPFALGLSGIPQLNSTTRLDDFGGNSMYLAAIRAFGNNGPVEAKAVINHAVDVGNDQAGTRWVQFGLSHPFAFGGGERVFASGFENSGPPAPPTVLNKRIVDQGTFAPDAESRWMGGINLDASGNIGVGHNVSSSAINPEIRVTGRERNDPAGILRDEQTCTPPNTGAQTGLFSGRARWGDYATMGVDPNDQCTFWFTNEYYATTSNSSWNTRFCAYKYASCGQVDFELEVSPAGRIQACSLNGAPTVSVRPGAYGGALAGNVALSSTGLPAGLTTSFSPAAVAAGEISQLTLNGIGALTPGPYSFTLSGTAGPLTRTRTIDIDAAQALAAVPTLTSPGAGATNIVIRPTLQWSAVSGATGYSVQIATSSAFTTIVDSATVTGTSYTSAVLLNVGQTYHWRVRSINPCGDSAFAASRSFTTGAPGSCPAGTSANAVFSDDVSGDAIAWTTENISGDAAAAWSKVTPPAGTGLTTRAWYADNSGTTADQRLISPAIVLPAASQSPIVLAFDAHHRYETDGSVDCWDGGLVEISTDNGVTFEALGNARNLADPYPGRLSSGNPAGGLEGWCRQPVAGTPIRTHFLLDGYAGQSVRLRFRSTADSNTVGPEPNGWAVDNIVVQGCQ